MPRWQNVIQICFVVSSALRTYGMPGVCVCVCVFDSWH